MPETRPARRGQGRQQRRGAAADSLLGPNSVAWPLALLRAPVLCDARRCAFAPYFICLGLASLAPFACSSTADHHDRGRCAPSWSRSTRPIFWAASLRSPRSERDDDGSAGDGSGRRRPAARPRRCAQLCGDAVRCHPAADGSVPNPGTPLASSPPTTCLKLVTFAFVVAGRRYLAEVDAYRERPRRADADQLGLSPAAPTRQWHASRARWGATCGGYPPSIYDAGAAGGAGTAGAGTAAAAREPRQRRRRRWSAPRRRFRMLTSPRRRTIAASA